MPQILREEEYKKIDDAITEVIRKTLVGTKILQPYRVSEATLELGWDKWTDMSDAQVDMYMEEAVFDNLSLGDRETISVPIAHKEFQINWRMLEAARSGNRDLETANAEAAAAKVAERLDEIIFKGVSSLGIAGLTNTSGIQSVTGADFGTAGNAYDTFRKARDKLIEANVQPPYVAVLNPVQYGELDILFSNTGIPQRQMIEGKFVEAVYYSDQITAGEGFVFAVGKQYMDRVTLGGIKRRVWRDQDTRNVKGQVYGIEVPRVRHATAIVKMTGI